MSSDSFIDIDALTRMMEGDDGDGDEPDAVDSAPSGGGRPEPCPFESLSYLIIEDSQTMRAWLRGAIVDVGGKRIEMSESYNDALYRIRTRGPYDVVLCDYILSDALDGQQLLEEVRRGQLLPRASLWMMITGERGYEQVFSAAELAPDDYLIKPITPAILLERLGRCWDRRVTLKPATDLHDAGDYEGAVAACREGIAKRKRHELSFLRLIGECLMRLEHYREAYEHYEQILVDRPRLPWARLGKARAFFHLDRHDESAEILGELMESTPEFLHAHDLMARVHEKKGDLEATKQLLKTVLQKNPKALHRHREVVRVALATDDPDSAIEAYALMHQHGKGSSFLKPGDFCAYANMLMKSDSRAAGDRLDALVSNLRDFHRDQAQFAFAGKMVRFASAKRSNNADVMRESYQQMKQAMEAAQLGGEAVDNEQTLALLEAAIGMKDEPTLLKLAQGLYMDYVGNESMCGRIDRLLAAGGLEHKAEELISLAEEQLREMNRAAVDLAKQGRMLDAVEEFARLADANRNIAVVLNAATAIVKYFEEANQAGTRIDPSGRKRLINKLESYLNFVRERDPANMRLGKIEEAFKSFVAAA